MKKILFTIMLMAGSIFTAMAQERNTLQILAGRMESSF